MVAFALWVAVTATMFVSGAIALPYLVGAVVGMTWALVANGSRVERLSKLKLEYRDRFEREPAEFSDGATRSGGALGAALGNYALGGALGLAIDLARAALRESTMGEQQKLLHRKIQGLEAWSPFHSLWILFLWTSLSAAAAGFFHG